MKKIKNAIDIPQLLTIVCKQCLKEPCRVCILFNDPECINKIVYDHFLIDLSYIERKYGKFKLRCGTFKTGLRSECSHIDICSPDFLTMRGKRYDYLLIDSSISDEIKMIARAMVIRSNWFVTNKKIRRKKDRRKNIIQEFALAEEWPLLSKTK